MPMKAMKASMKAMKAVKAVNDKKAGHAVKTSKKAGKAMKAMKAMKIATQAVLQKMPDDKGQKVMAAIKNALKDANASAKAEESQWYFADTRGTKEVLIEYRRNSPPPLKLWRLDG